MIKQDNSKKTELSQLLFLSCLSCSSMFIFLFIKVIDEVAGSALANEKKEAF
jgi:hypothetical protein